jgi:outer membrane protein
MTALRVRKLLTAAVIAALTTPVQAEDLAEVFRLAQQNDAQFAAARAARDAAVERAPQGLAQLLPGINLSAGRTETDLDVTTPAIDNTYRYGTNAYSLTLSQPIFRKQNFAAYEQGKAEATRADYQLAGARQDLILRVSQTYLTALAAQDIHEFTVAEKEAINRLRDLTQRNVSVGIGTIVDVHDAQSTYDLAVAQEIEAANTLEVRREALRVLTGQRPGILARLTQPLPLELPQPAQVEPWEEAARADNPRVLAQQQAVASAAQELEKSRGGHYPTLDLNASHAYNDAGGSVQGFALETRTNQVGLLFNLPLYQGGGTQSRVREAAARQDEAGQQLEQLRRESALGARDAFTAVRSGLARVQALERALASNRRALESTVLGYERGVRNASDVLIAQRLLFRTRRDLAEQRYLYLQARLRLKAAVGALADDDIDQVNRLLGYAAAATP